MGEIEFDKHDMADYCCVRPTIHHNPRPEELSSPSSASLTASISRLRSDTPMFDGVAGHSKCQPSLISP